ncbi:MAG: inositol monophosphatase [Candidatus Omnitrophota bacterium]
MRKILVIILMQFIVINSITTPLGAVTVDALRPLSSELSKNDFKENELTAKVISEEVLPAVRKMAKAAGEIMLSYKGKLDSLRKEMKSDKTIVTEVDTKIQEMVIQEIRSLFPTHYIVGEEEMSGIKLDKSSRYTWTIDPLDGTKEFVKDGSHYGFSICLMDEGSPILSIFYAPEYRIDGEHEYSLFEACEGIEGAYLNGKKITISKSTDFKNKKCLVVGSAAYGILGFEHKLRSLFGGGDSDCRSTTLEICRVACGGTYGEPIFFAKAIICDMHDVMPGIYIAEKAKAINVDFKGSNLLPVDKTRLRGESPRFHTVMVGSEETIKHVLPASSELYVPDMHDALRKDPTIKFLKEYTGLENLLDNPVLHKEYLKWLGNGKITGPQKKAIENSYQSRFNLQLLNAIGAAA